MTSGDEDHKTLYLTAKTGLYRIRLNVKGAGFRINIVAGIAEKWRNLSERIWAAWNLDGQNLYSQDLFPDPVRKQCLPSRSRN